MEKPQYIDWIVEETGIVIKDDIPLKCYKIDYKDDESILDDWALHIRRNYIEDTELKEDADDNAMTIEQYLHDYVIPQKGEELGATVRSADITEILISDLLEFVHQYSVPRYKLKNRSGKNNSQQGTDVIAYKYKNEDKTPNDKDELVAAEVKATLSNMEYTPIKNAIIDSRKDEHRLARSVNYCRKRLKELGKIEEAEEVKRFLFKPDNNYRITYVAAGVSSRENVDDAIELGFSGEELEIRKNELIFYVHGKKLMELAHNIYQRGATYELLVTHIRQNMTSEQQLVLLSAVLPNSGDIAQWLFEDRGCLATDDSIVSTPKSIGFSSTQRDIHFFSDDKSNEDYYIPRILRVEQLMKLPRERSNKYFPDLSLSTDVAIYNAIKLCHNGGVAIYLGQQRSMKTVFERIINLDKRNYDLKALKDNTNQAELSKIKGFIESYYGSEHYYTKAAELGVLPHSSNLQNGVKLVVEHALKNKYVSCVVCTSTLAQGVNIPIKYLLVTSIRNGLKLVKARDFQNLMGRTARAGIYTEGSIIITDCKIYDNRTNWKNGGRYLWNDCVKLFDIKLTEPCGSSILALVQDFNIDYDVTISGEKFIDIVIDHLDERDFLLDYAKKLEKAYLKANPKRTQNLIVQEILLRQDIISNIENYLCLVRSTETLVNDSKKSAVDICTNTLAYAMATEKEKELLIKVFQKIEENIQQYSVEKLSRYSNAMSGIGLSSLIEEWIVQNELTEKIYTETELLYVITELYLQICGDFRYQEHIQSICKKWIDGQTPMEINNKETIGIAEVESLCNKRISYEMNFLIGNICDLIEVDGENEEQVDQRNILTLLQKKVKYGVPNMTAISICESVFNDRLLAIELAQILSDANIGTDKILNMLKAHSEEIFSCLDSYPEYFKDRLSVLMK